MTVILRKYQIEAINNLRGLLRDGSKRLLLQASTGAGKCLGKGTPVLMHDGSIKKVEDVVVGDLLMGPDSTPRVVQSTCSGVEELFKVVPVKGDSYIVNRSHILSLKATGTKGVKHSGFLAGSVHNFTIDEYLSLPKSKKHILKGYRVGVEFKENKIDQYLPPYILGVWLGDGRQGVPMITSADHEVAEEWISHTIASGVDVRVENGHGCKNYFATMGMSGEISNPIKSALRRSGVIFDKHIPDNYKINTRFNRLELLAGLIDTDGYYDVKSISITVKQEKLANDIAFLCRSLGMAAYVSQCKKTIKSLNFSGLYYKVSISGNLDSIPCRVPRRICNKRKQIKDVLRTGISVIPHGVGEYFGFEIDGDRLFLLGDFTVTHNTVLACDIIQSAIAKGNRCLFIAHRKEIIQQTSAKLDLFGVDHGIIMADNPRYRPNLPVQCASIQTLSQRHKPAFDLVIIDECHLSCSQSFVKLVEHYKNSVILGLTATPIRLDGKGLGTIYQTITEVVPMRQLIDEGFLVQPRVFAPFNPDLTGIKTIAGDYDKNQVAEVMDKASITGDIIKHWQQHADGRKTIVFAASVKHSEHITAEFNAIGIEARHLDAKTSDWLREKTLNEWRAGKFPVLSNCGLFIEGLDVPEVSCCILARPTQSLTIYLQAVGRAMRPAPGKSDAIILDHAGLTYRHGLIDEHREWSLDGKKKSKKRDSEEKAPNVAICESCFAAFNKQEHNACPQCGNELPVKARKNHAVCGDGELIELTKDQVDQLKLRRKQELKNARTKEQLVALGKQRGYRFPNQWADRIIDGRKQYRTQREAVYG